jgi:hypothetical protein
VFPAAALKYESSFDPDLDPSVFLLPFWSCVVRNGVSSSESSYGFRRNAALTQGGRDAVCARFRQSLVDFVPTTVVRKAKQHQAIRANGRRGQKLSHTVEILETSIVKVRRS